LLSAEKAEHALQDSQPDPHDPDVGLAAGSSLWPADFRTGTDDRFKTAANLACKAVKAAGKSLRIIMIALVATSAKITTNCTPA